jgi:uncharacterized membrane protein
MTEQDSASPAPPNNITEPTSRIEALSPEEKQKLIVELLSFTTSFFSGPLPPPETFKEYEKALKGSADRILKMAENEQSHRHRLDLEEIRSERLGLGAGFALAAILMMGGLVLIGIGRDIGGVAVIGTAIATIAGVFIYSQRRKRAAPDETPAEGVRESSKQ